MAVFSDNIRTTIAWVLILKCGFGSAVKSGGHSRKGTKGNVCYNLLPDVPIQIIAYGDFIWRVLELKPNQLLTN